jgi:hypothetical protein
MSLIDKLYAASALPPETDLLDFLGYREGDPFVISRNGLTVGGETVPIDEARLALAGGPIPASDPRRSVVIGDL